MGCRIHPPQPASHYITGLELFAGPGSKHGSRPLRRALVEKCDISDISFPLGVRKPRPSMVVQSVSQILEGEHTQNIVKTVK